LLPQPVDEIKVARRDIEAGRVRASQMRIVEDRSEQPGESTTSAENLSYIPPVKILADLDDEFGR
jgi:hypothetical protein